MTDGSSGERPDPRSRHPRLWTALAADARTTAAFRGERHEFRSRLDAIGQMLRLAAVSDAFAGQAFYRLKASLQRRRVPVLPRILQRLAIASAAIYIGDRVVVQPGLYVVHGQVVLAGRVEVQRGVAISPAVTVAHPGGRRPTVIGPGASLGAGSRVIGAVAIGARAQIGAGSVVLDDVPDRAMAVGVPARIVDAPDPG